MAYLNKKNSVQWLEEPEDMSIYCVCCSKYYGLISGIYNFASY